MTRHHLHAVPTTPPANTVSSFPCPSEALLAAHEFLRKPRRSDYPYDLCIDLLEAVIDRHVRLGHHPSRWTAEDVADLLATWFPDPPLDAPERLRYLPDLIGEFVAFVHLDHVAPEVTAAVTATIERLRPEFLCAVGAYGWETPPYPCQWPEPVENSHPLQDLADLVGGLVALEHLDTTPLPEEPFAWTAVPGELVPMFEDLVPLLDACADQVLTLEHRTAMRRFVAGVAQRDPRPLRRGTVPRRALSIAWCVLRANDDLGPGRGRLLTAKDLAAWFGLTGDVSGPGRTMLQAFGGSLQWTHSAPDRVRVGDGRLLTADRRAQIVADRDRRDLGAGSEPQPRWPFS